MKKVALFTVIYSGAETYIDEFIASVRSQTFVEFDLIIVNDGYIYNNLSVLYSDLNIIELEGHETIAGNRAIGINYAIENNYDFIFLCDVDDYMHPCRVEYVLDAFEDNDIIVNDLDIVDANRKLIFKNYFQKSISKDVLLDKEFIKDKNIFGFSNSAIRVSSLSLVEFPNDLRIVDWFFFTHLLNNGLKANFLRKSLTEYRQHSGNMIGISSFTLDVFKKLLTLKIKHYAYFKDVSAEYRELYEEMTVLSNIIDSELQIIINNNTEKIPYPMWWQNIKF